MSSFTVLSSFSVCSSSSIPASIVGGGGEFTPKCTGHGERCQQRTVKKAGKNQGRSFFTCPRAEGPKSEPESNCGFFQWADAVVLETALGGHLRPLT